MASAHIHPYRLPLKRPWVAASATLTERHGALLQLFALNGLEGWGDCAPLPSSAAAWHTRTLEVLANTVSRATRAELLTADPDWPAEVRWAVETAQADIAAQRAGLPLAHYLNPAAPLDVAINAALGPLDDGLDTRLAAAHAQGFKIGKIKVGIAPLEEEIAHLKALDSPLLLRLDTNRAWNDTDARRFLAAIADLPIDAVEEPLAAPSLDALAQLQAGLPYALAIDESLPDFGIDAIIATRAVRRLVLKPARLGGIAATCAIAQAARAAGIEVVLTSVVDSAVGVAATAHLAAALSPHLAHGLGTSDWLAEDVALPLPVVAGRLMLADAPGLGIRPIGRPARQS